MGLPDELVSGGVLKFRVYGGSDCSAMAQRNSQQSDLQRRLVPRGFWQRITPPQLFVASFALLIFAGVLGFRLLPGLFDGERLGWIDSLFMATSAVCVTGLSVITTADRLTFSGELFLLLLVQLGALGILTFKSDHSRLRSTTFPASGVSCDCADRVGSAPVAA